MPKFLLDVNVPKDIWLFLKKEGYFFECLHNIQRDMQDIDVAKLALKKN